MTFEKNTVHSEVTVLMRCAGLHKTGVSFLSTADRREPTDGPTGDITFQISSEVMFIRVLSFYTKTSSR